MAKLTKEGLNEFVGSYVSASKQAGAWQGTTNNFFHLIDKIGKIVNLKGDFSDKLPELEGDELPAGKTIEETLMDLVLPTKYGLTGHQTIEDATSEGAKAIVPAYPTIEDAAYSYTLGRIKTSITRPYGYIEAGALSAEGAASLAEDVMFSLQASISVDRYYIKKQLLANAISKANTAGLVKEIAVPVDEESSEAFIKQVKEDVEDASFAGEGKSLSGAFIGAAPQLVLFVKKKVLPTVEVEALAGAFNENRLALPATVRVVEDFANDETGAWAVLADPRGIKLHNSYRAIRNDENGSGDFMNIYEHEENTAFISKHTYIKVYKEPTE